ncbi:MATE family efflux transporter [Acanthopleuribacter pedis]|uniref:MATE family efflux transporter n=1 Tax=Acanthopleuribacter pedis TaxID=442870 RepID=A0A8J7QFC4_9BACT|nr:MATE family efflux transporter [Acanthopleuribacter pedis]MBO1317380.1 MATE family efflux transporter [Acanthopleuribacter pedis]
MSRSFDSMLTEGPVSTHLIKMTVPMALALSATMAFNLADTYFVGQLGDAQLTALSFTFPPIMLLISLTIGIGAGTSSVIARAIGERNERKVRHLTTDSLLLSTLLSLFFTALGLFTLEPVFRMLGADDTTMPYIKEFMIIWYLGFITVMVPMVGMAALRATGDVKTPATIMVGVAIANMFLDPLLIFGLGPIPALGIEGAALATLITRGVSLIWVFYLLSAKHHMLRHSLPSLGDVAANWRAILHVGLPASATNMIIPLCISVAVALLATHGNDAVAAHGVASRVESMSLVIFYAMSAIIGPFVGQNFGAGRFDRIRESLIGSFLFCLGFTVLLALALGFGADWTARRFTEDEAIIHWVVVYLTLVPLSYGCHGIIMVANAAFNALGRPFPATVISTMRMVVVYTPAILIGSKFFGVTGIFVATTIANVSVSIVAWLWVVYFLRRRQEDNPEPTAPTDTVPEAG